MTEQENKRTKPTRSQVQVLKSDWLGNLRMGEKGGYTHSGAGGMRHSGPGDITDYVIGDVRGLDSLDLIKKSLAGARNLANGITPRHVNVSVGADVSCHSLDDGVSNICLATDYFDDPRLLPKEKATIMLGLACHESAHAAFTDQSVKEELLRGEPEQTMELKHQIWNIIEDERIEYLLGDENPGLSPLLADTKRYFYKRLTEDMKVNGQEPTETVPRLINSLVQAVRYPSELTDENIVEHFDELDAIRKILTPYPLTPQGACAAAEKVMDVIRSLVKKDLENQQQQQQQQQQSSGQGGQGSDGQQQGQPQQQDSKSSDSSSGSSGKKPRITQKQIQQAIEKALQTEQGKAVMDALKKDDSKGQSTEVKGNSSSSLRGDAKRVKYVNEDDSEKCGAGSGFPNTFIFRPKGSADSYNNALRRVRALIPAMSKALACKSHESEYVCRGMPTGKLNTNRLVAFRAGNKNIFDKRGETSCSSASVCLLIDESGSMSGGKCHAAREAAVLVNEAIKRIGTVSYYCYGYTSHKINIYAEGPKSSKWALGGTEATSGTPTGTAMDLVAQRVRRYTGNPVLMLVLTDGSADDNSRVTEMIHKLSRESFVVIGVGIQTPCVSYSFPEYVILNDISKLPMELGKLTKKHLDRMLVKTSGLV